MFTRVFSLRRGVDLPGLPVKVKVTKSCPTLCDTMDCSLPGSSVHGLLQARILEWVAISFPRGSSQHRDGSQVSCICRQILYHLSHQGSPVPAHGYSIASEPLFKRLFSQLNCLSSLLKKKTSYLYVRSSVLFFYLCIFTSMPHHFH